MKINEINEFDIYYHLIDKKLIIKGKLNIELSRLLDSDIADSMDELSQKITFNLENEN